MSGAGIFMHRQFKALQELGAKITVVVPVEDHPPFPLSILHADWSQAQKMNYPAEREYDTVLVLHPRISNPKPGKIFRKNYEQRFIDDLARYFTDKKLITTPNKTIFFAQWMPSAYKVTKLAKRLNVKTATMLIGDDVNVWPFASDTNKQQFVEGWRSTDLRLSVANYLAEQANKIVGDALPYHSIYRGTDTSIFKPVGAIEKQALRSKLGFNTETPLILCIGTAIVAKGWLNLLEALKDIAAQGIAFKLVCIYSGENNINIIEEATTRNANEYIIDIGEVPSKDIAQYMQAADVFCLPSHREGIANAVVEAMACGLPVVTTNICGHPELVANEEIGLLIPMQNIEALTDKIKILLKDKNLRASIGANAANYIKNVWGNTLTNNRKLLDLFERLCSD